MVGVQTAARASAGEEATEMEMATARVAKVAPRVAKIAGKVPAARVAKVAAAKIATSRVTKAAAMLTKVPAARVTKAAARTTSKAANTALITIVVIPCASWQICQMCFAIKVCIDCC